MKPRIKEMNKFVQFITNGFAAGITLAPFGIYILKKYMGNKRMINHESIHWKQQMEMIIAGMVISLLFIMIISLLSIITFIWVSLNFWVVVGLTIFPLLFFYLWYLIEWLVRIPINGKGAYRSLSFEREAYDNDDNLKYLETRKPFSWFKYLIKKRN